MNVDPDIVVMMGNILAVNVVVMLLLAVLSYVLSALMLNGLAAVDRWLDPSRTSTGSKQARLDR